MRSFWFLGELSLQSTSRKDHRGKGMSGVQSLLLPFPASSYKHRSDITFAYLKVQAIFYAYMCIHVAN